MSQKQRVRQHCIDYLQKRNLFHYFNDSEFERMWRSQKDKNCNAYTLGMSTADNLLFTAKPINDDGGNEE